MTATHIHEADCVGAHATTPKHWAATRRGAASLLGFLTAISAWVLVRNPLANTVFPPCPLHVTTGLWCPGCGATRASYLLFHGDVTGALHFNALWVVLAPLTLYQVLAFAGQAFGVRGLRRIPFNRPVIATLLVAMTAFFVVRNLPFGPFEVLNPITRS